MGAIYIISNDVNNKVYIGRLNNNLSTVDFCNIREATHGASEAKLYVAMREIGIEHFSVNTLLDDITADVLDVMEVYFINKYDSYNNGYNSTIGGTMGRNFVYENTILTKDHIDPEHIARSIVDAFSKTLYNVINMSEVCKQIGACIKRLRNEKNLTQEQLSKLAKVGIKQISKMENGHGDVSIIAIGRVFRALGSPARLVLYENPSPSGDPFWDIPENMDSVVRFKADVDARRGIHSEVNIDKVLSIDL